MYLGGEGDFHFVSSLEVTAVVQYLSRNHSGTAQLRQLWQKH
jgi:hypothetical protein